MKQIQKYINTKLKENKDLIDNKEIDITLTYEEQKTLVDEKINPLLNIDEKLKELIQSQQMGFNTPSKKDVWKIVRGCWN